MRKYRRLLDVCAVGSLGVMGAKPLCKPPGGAGFCIAKTMPKNKCIQIRPLGLSWMRLFCAL